MIHDYKCDKCNIIFEFDDSFNAVPICPKCGEKSDQVRKVYGSCNVVINCKGTYKHDNTKI